MQKKKTPPTSLQHPLAWGLGLAPLRIIQRAPLSEARHILFSASKRQHLSAYPAGPRTLLFRATSLRSIQLAPLRITSFVFRSRQSSGASAYHFVRFSASSIHWRLRVSALLRIQSYLHWNLRNTRRHCDGVRRRYCTVYEDALAEEAYE